MILQSAAAAMPLLGAAVAWEPNLAWIVAVALGGLAVIRWPWIGLAGLWIGLALLSRTFAHAGLHLGSIPLYVSDAALALSGVAMLAGRLVQGRIPLPWPPLAIALLAYLALGALALARGTGYGLEALRDSMLVFYSVAAWLVVALVRDFAQFQKILRWAWGVCMMALALFLVMKAGWLPMPEKGGPNMMMVGMGFVGLVAYQVMDQAARTRTLYLLDILLLLVLLLQSRAAWVATAVSIGFIGFAAWCMGRLPLVRQLAWRWGWVLTGLAVVGALVVPIPRDVVDTAARKLAGIVRYEANQDTPSANALWRVLVWRDMRDEIIREPWLGVGFGKPFFSKRAEAMGGYVYPGMDPHNSHLAVAYRMGLPGLTAHAALILGTLLRGLVVLRRVADPSWRAPAMAVLSALVFATVFATFTVVLEGPFYGLPFWLVLGAALWLGTAAPLTRRRA